MALVTLAALQICPLPAPLVRVLSPAAFRLHQTAGMEGGWATLSVSAGHTIQAAATLVVPLAAFLLVLNTVKTREDIRSMISAMVLIGSSIALFGIIQRLTWNGKLYWMKDLPPTNAFGPYVNRNHFAGLMVMLVPLALGYCLSLRHRRGDAPRTAPWKESAAFLLAGVMAAALLVTGSRGGIISLAAGLLFMAAAATMRFGKSKGGTAPTVKRLWAIGAAGTACSAAFLWWEGFFRRFFNDPGIGIRWSVWVDSARAAWDFWLPGSGLGTYERIFPFYKTVQTRYIYTYAHNEYLQAAVEGGILLLLVIGWALYRYSSKCSRMISARHDREVIWLGLGALSGGGALLFNGLLDFNFRIPANALCFAVITGLTICILNSPYGVCSSTEERESGIVDMASKNKGMLAAD